MIQQTSSKTLPAKPPSKGVLMNRLAAPKGLPPRTRAALAAPMPEILTGMGMPEVMRSLADRLGRLMVEEYPDPLEAESEVDNRLLSPLGEQLTGEFMGEPDSFQAGQQVMAVESVCQAMAGLLESRGLSHLTKREEKLAKEMVADQVLEALREMAEAATL